MSVEDLHCYESRATLRRYWPARSSRHRQQEPLPSCREVKNNGCLVVPVCHFRPHSNAIATREVVALATRQQRRSFAHSTPENASVSGSLHSHSTCAGARALKVLARHEAVRDVLGLHRRAILSSAPWRRRHSGRGAVGFVASASLARHPRHVS